MNSICSPLIVLTNQTLSKRMLDEDALRAKTLNCESRDARCEKLTDISV
jgi:hypothetical protein